MPKSRNKEMLSILSIEDNQADTELLRIYLKELRLKHRLITAESLSEGINLIEQEDQIDLVFLDLNLPDSPGANSTFSNFRKRSSRKLPVVVMTGLNDVQRGKALVNEGAEDYLVKGDFNAKRLGVSIDFALARFDRTSVTEKLVEEVSKENNILERIGKMNALATWSMDMVDHSMEWSEDLFKILEEAPYGYTRSQSDYLSYVHPEDEEKVREFFGEAMRNQEHGPLTHRFRLRNLTTKVVNLRAQMNFDEKSNKIQLIGSVRLTEGSSIPDQQPSPNEGNQVTSPDRTAETVTDFFEGFNFNLRTPLSSAVNLLYLLEQSNLTQQQADYVAELKYAIDDLSFLLGSLINLTIVEREELVSTVENFNPKEILEPIQRVMSFKAQQHQRTFEMTIQDGLSISVRGDSAHLSQLLFCWLELAFGYSNPEKTLQHTCSFNQEDSTLSLTLRYDGRLPEHWRQDESTSTQTSITGREQLLLNGFNRLSEHMNVEHHGTESPQGILLTLRIPLIVNAALTGSLPSIPQQSLRILLAEDHSVQRLAIKNALETWTPLITVDEAENGKEALRIFRENTYDLVLIDLVMPEMDGMTLANRLRQSSSVPMIALTANISKYEESRCKRFGMNDYIVKPVSPDELRQRIMRLLNQRET